jgi:hypothetical protein
LIFDILLTEVVQFKSVKALGLKIPSIEAYTLYPFPVNVVAFVILVLVSPSINQTNGTIASTGSKTVPS